MSKRILKISGFIALIFVLITGIYFLASYAVDTKISTTSAIQSQTNAETGRNIGILAYGEKNPDIYRYRTDTGVFEALREQYGVTNYMDPKYPGFELYCIEPGAAISYIYQIRYNKAKSLDGKTDTEAHGCAPADPHLGMTTPPVYKPIGTKRLPVAAAYVVSAEAIDKWTEEKQRAIWNLRDLGGEYAEFIKGTGISDYAGGSKYDQEARDYHKYDGAVRGKGLNPEDKTDLKEVKPKVDQIKKEYTLGPFNITYTNGIYGKIAFSGISDMIITGYNSEKEVVNTNIKVKKFILKDMATGIDGSAVTPEFFTPDPYKVDRNKQVYPVSGQDFQIVFDDPNAGLKENDPNRVKYISIKVKFKYMLANGQYTELQGLKYTVAEDHDDIDHCCHKSHEDCDDCCHSCTRIIELPTTDQQTIASVDAIRSIYDQELQIGGKEPPEETIDITMDLGGHVWEDVPATKEDKTDGVSNTTGENGLMDKPLKNVKVTLYTEDGKIATLLSDPKEEGLTDAQVMHRINPTYTDEEGNYLFDGLDPMKKYYVSFEYNGQTYLPTDYLKTGENEQYSTVNEMVNAKLYNTDSWKLTSKGTETVEDRDNYDKNFAEIGSYPENYSSSNSLGKTGNKNATFTHKDLMGYTLDREGKYHQTTTQLIDGYLYDENGGETEEYRDGVISQKVRQYVKDNKKFPDENAMKEIYSSIAGDNLETWRMLQFIEDCQIYSYTQGQGQQYKDLYPVYDYFVINDPVNRPSFKTAKEAQEKEYNTNIIVLDGKTYNPIYPGQYFVNQGLWRRQVFDAAMRKDVYKAVLKINRKTEVYGYTKRPATEEESGEDEKYWDINVRMSDYGKYYDLQYNREVYKADYDYTANDLNHPGADLEVYVTYKLTVRNQSQSIMTQIKEVVDYYDKDYDYKENLSWIVYKDDQNLKERPNQKDLNTSYEKAMKENNLDNVDILTYFKGTKNENMVHKTKSDNETKAYYETKYNDTTYSNISGKPDTNGKASGNNQYNAVYIRGLENKKLATGESAYIYLTFKVRNGTSKKAILDDGYSKDGESPKMNYAEINGYATYYRDDTKLPNNITKNSSDIAGLIDRDSNPGNLVQSDIDDKDRGEKNFEDDTDRAPALRVIIDKDAVRKANGTVWEDQRTVVSGNSIIGDGVRQGDEHGVAGVTVQLVEKTFDGKEYIWQEKTTKADGTYEFDQYIPGDYVIRFYYGNSEQTVKLGTNSVSYNGQDFKSTVYQKDLNAKEGEGIDQNLYTDELQRYKGYTDVNNQNITGKYIAPGEQKEADTTYGYNIYAADSNETNFSDAKDLYSTKGALKVIAKKIPQGCENSTPYSIDKINGRQQVIDYSADNVTNHIAEVLASPYERPAYRKSAENEEETKYNDEEMNKLINELINNTYMTAETGIIAVEFEYDRQQTDGDKETENNSSNSSKDYVTESNRYNGNYVLANIDLGLTERPKAQLELDKKISNIKVTLANGSVLFDVNKAGDNVIWKPHEAYNLAQNKNKGKYNDYYGTSDKHRYSFREKVNNIVENSDKGLVQLTMDEELMHGATIEIKYKLTVTNVGETDYNCNEYYYLGNYDETKIVKTTANQVVDYVANNLQFDANNAENKRWSVIEHNTLITSDKIDENSNLVNFNLKNRVQQYNTTVQTDGLAQKLAPGATTEKVIVLSQLISTENSSYDLTYRNMAEIVKTSNDVGRRMAFSVVGNQDPMAEDGNVSEVDASSAEKVIILPPFGNTHIQYILIAVVAVILIGGITFIIVKVNKKRE